LECVIVTRITLHYDKTEIRKRKIEKYFIQNIFLCSCPAARPTAYCKILPAGHYTAVGLLGSN